MDSQNARQRDGGRRSADGLIPYATLLLLLGATALGTVLIQRSERDAHQARFERHVEEKQARIVARMEAHVSLLRGGAGLFAASEADGAGVNREQFARFVQRLDVEQRYPGLIGIGFATVASSADLPRIEEQQRRDGEINFHVWPTSAAESHAVVLYIEPQNPRNHAAIGFDMMSEPTRAEALRRTRDSGTAVLSDRVTLVQERGEEKQAGFLLMVPVWRGNERPATVEERRARLRGFVYGAFRAGDMFRATLVPDEEVANYQIYDGIGTDPGRLLHDAQGSGGVVATGETAAVRVLTTGDHSWTLRFVDADPSSPLGTSARWFAPIGVLVSLALFLLARAQVRFARALHEEKIRAESEADLRERVVAIVGHDLRNPLSAISMAGHLLVHREELPERERAVAQRIVDSAARMSRIIAQLLDYARLRQGRSLSLSLTSGDVAAVTRDVVEELRLARPDAVIGLEREGDCAVVCDVDSLAQVVSNLVGNALQHGEGAVTVRVRGEEDVVVLDVHNRGPPIPPAVLPRIFEPFQRGESSMSLGLGLYISREIVRAHGGQMEVRSSAEQGTTFVVRLPRGRGDNDPKPVPTLTAAHTASG